MINQSKEIQALTHHNEALENYFRNTIIPQMYVDGELILRKFTPSAMKQFKLSDNDIGKSVSDLTDRMRFPTFEQNIRQVMESNEILEKEIQTTDLRWYQMNILPYLKKEQKGTDGVIITFVDITMRIEDLKAQEKLIAENALLLDTISHDLRGPLGNLKILIELIKSISPDDEEEFTSHLQMVDKALESMDTVISELTEVRKEDYELQNHAELVNIEHILEDVRISLSEKIAETDAIITSKIMVSEINFPRRKFRTVLYNLINNAIKFKSPGKKPVILITTYEENDFVVMAVQDNGIGIPANKIDTVFTKYGRVNNDIHGSGLGLYLVNEIVTSAGGKIEVESQKGGSEFKVYIKLD